MKDFTYSYPAHVYFGKGALANALKAELPAVAKKVLLAYGGGSIKKNGIYEELTGGTLAEIQRQEEYGTCKPRPRRKSKRAPAPPSPSVWTT